MPQLFTLTITPRFYETDGVGHINNVSIAGWFETARIRAMESLGAEGELMHWVLASIKIDFQSETFYGEEVTATVPAITPGNRSLTVDCQMTQQGRNTAFGRAVMVHLDRDGGGTAPMPQEMRERLSGYGKGAG